MTVPVWDAEDLLRLLPADAVAIRLWHAPAVLPPAAAEPAQGAEAIDDPTPESAIAALARDGTFELALDCSIAIHSSHCDVRMDAIPSSSTRSDSVSRKGWRWYRDRRSGGSFADG